MYNNTRDSRPSGGRSFPRREYGSSTGPRQMFKAVCSSCGKDCEVPFMPTGSKPVYCSICFEKQPGGMSKPAFDNKNNISVSQNNAQLTVIITKLDKIIALLSSCSSDSCCQDDACCQKEVPQVAKPHVMKEEAIVAVEGKVKAPKKSTKSPKK